MKGYRNLNCFNTFLKQNISPPPRPHLNVLGFRFPLNLKNQENTPTTPEKKFIMKEEVGQGLGLSKWHNSLFFTYFCLDNFYVLAGLQFFFS